MHDEAKDISELFRPRKIRSLPCFCPRRAPNNACRFYHKGHEDIVITVIDLEAADLDAHSVAHAEAIAKLPGLRYSPAVLNKLSS
jgi:hypothetical protein